MQNLDYPTGRNMNIKEFLRHIPKIERTIGYTFKDKSLLTQSFTRTSFCNEYKGRGECPQSNEVLEFIGDAVLSISIITVLLSDLTERYKFGIKTELKEGDLSNIKSKLSDKRNLSRSMAALELSRYLIMGEGDIKLNIKDEPSVMEDLFESIIGAIYIDSGLDVGCVMKSVKKMLDMSIYRSRDRVAGSAKGALQEWCADKKRRLSAPEYKTVSEDGPDHKKTYERAVYVDGVEIARAKAKNLKSADAECAVLALAILKKKEAKDTGAKASDQPKKSAEKPFEKAPCKPAEAAASKKKTAKKAPDVSGYAKKLHDYALLTKSPLPRFRDLGEFNSDDSTKTYRVECSYLDIVTIGYGSERKGAREASAFNVIKELKARKQKKK